MDSKRKLNTLTYADKLKVIKAVKSGTRRKVVAEQFGISSSTISVIMRSEAEYLKKQQSGHSLLCKRQKPAVHPGLDKCLFTWYKQCRNKNIPVGGKMLKEKAEQFAVLLGIRTFKGSNGWLQSFKKRHAVSFKLGHKPIKHRNEHQEENKIKQESEATEEIQLDSPGLIYENPEDVFVEETTFYSGSEELEEEDPVQKRSRNSSTTSKRHRLEESQETELSNITRMMKDLSSHLHVLTHQRQDRFDSFGKYVSAMLRNMPENKALQVQPQIVNLLVAASVKTEERDIFA